MPYYWVRCIPYSQFVDAPTGLEAMRRFLLANQDKGPFGYLVVACPHPSPGRGPHDDDEVMVTVEVFRGLGFQLEEVEWR